MGHNEKASVPCPVPGCRWYARIYVVSAENQRSAELRRDKHLVERHNGRLWETAQPAIPEARAK